jgi:hypothetical protein
MDPEPTTPPESRALTEAYRGLAHAHMLTEDLQAQLRTDLEQLAAKETELQARRAETDDGSDEANQIDAELDELWQAMRTAKEQLDDEDPGGPHEQQGADGQADQRGGRGDDPGPQGPAAAP